MTELKVIVKQVRQEALDVRSFELVAADAKPLPAFTPGSHIDVESAPGIVRQYSLCNGSAESGHYLIAVKREPESRGRSQAMHESVREGDTLSISAPRNNFRLVVGAGHHLLLAVAESPIAIRTEGSVVKVDKEMPICNPPPFYQYLGRLSAEDKVERWQRTVYQPPGYIVIDVGVEALQPVPGSVRVEGRVIDLITPESATSSHYFWAFARNFRIDELPVTEFLRENVRKTFDEDKEMLEAQQRIIGSETDPVFQVAIKADAGPTQGRRLLASMIESEARGSTA
jgi:hypothetical protein